MLKGKSDITMYIEHVSIMVFCVFVVSISNVYHLLEPQKKAKNKQQIL